MKSKSTSASIKMPDSEIRVGIEAAKKPLNKKYVSPKLKMNETSNMPEPVAKTKDATKPGKKLPKRKK